MMHYLCEVNKKMKPVVVWAVAMLLVGSLLWVPVGWWLREEEVLDNFQAGRTYEAGLAPVYEPVASLLVYFNTTTFDHSANIDANGSVTGTNTISKTLTIENNDDTRTAKNIAVLLQNPRTFKDGLHDNLETDDLEVYVTVGGFTSTLFHDGEYSADGYTVGNIGPGNKVSFIFTVEVNDAVAGTFQDGQTYTCAVYVNQPLANYIDTTAFTILT